MIFQESSVNIRNFSPKVILKRFDSTSKSIISLLEFSCKKMTNLLSYSYSLSVDDVKGSFNISIKDSYIIEKKSNIFDLIQNLDIVEIYKDYNNKIADFIGIIHEKKLISSISSSGKVRKEISVIGKSIVSLFSDFNINLSVIGIAATSNNAQNIVSKLNFYNIEKNSVTNKNVLVPKTMNSVVSNLWNQFKEYALSLSSVSNIYLLELIEKFELEIKCDSINCKYPIAYNFYSESELSYDQFLRTLFPQGVYEIFANGKSLIIRETPFLQKNWNSLSSKNIDMSYLTEYDLSISDSEVYSVFYGEIEGLKEFSSTQNQNKLSANERGFIKVKTEPSTINKYGYKLCAISFLGYTQNPESEDDEQSDLLDKINSDVQEMYSHVHEMFSGRIKIIDSKSNTINIGEKVVFKVGTDNFTIQETEFYVKNASFSWNYGSSAIAEYTLSRGGVYKEGKFEQTPKYFSTNIERTILEKK